MKKACIADKVAIAKILYAKGIHPDDMAIDSAETWVEEKDGEIKGFFTVGNYEGIPYVIHFFSKGCFYRLAAAVKRIVRERGRKSFIVNALANDAATNKFVETYLSTRAYAERDGQKYYFAEVN